MCYYTEIHRHEALTEIEERGMYLNSPSLGENSHGGGVRPETWMMPSVVRRSGKNISFEEGGN